MNPHRILAVLCLVLVGIGLGMCAHAEPLTVGLHVHSVHVPAKESDSNQNWGLYVRTETGLTIGMYRSTIRRNAPYIGQTFSLYGPVNLTLGVIGSYQRKNGEGWSRGYFGPLSALSIASPVQVMGVTPRLTLVPGHLVKSRTVLHLSMEARF